jgi:ribosomal protein L11 methyltransferase
MGYTSLVLDLETDGAERLSDALLEAGALSVSVEDPLAGTPAEVPLYDEPDWQEDGQTPRWASSRLRILVAEDHPGGPAQILKEAAKVAGLATVPGYQLEHVAEQDWVRKTQAQFAPIAISERLWIVPSWHQPPDPQAINIALDPGVAFGTGSHPTTKLCLRWLESRILGTETVLDYGCGSGILAIAAKRLGAGRVVGVDIEPGAVAAARDNAVRNGVIAEFLDASEPLAMESDIVVANILANPLKMLAPALAQHTRIGGSIALAGVLVHQADEVMAAYAPWFKMAPGEQEEGWICLSGQRG